MKDMEFHDAANIFPMADETLGELADDIKKNGQQVPIEIMDGKVLDGRRRWLACKMAGVSPLTRDVIVDDPVAHVWSLNAHRRHLSETQLSMCAARAKEVYEKQAKERQRMSQGRGVKGVENLPHLNSEQGKSRDAVGKKFGVSGRSVDNATRVLTNGTAKVIAACDADKVAVSTAAKMVKLPKDEQDEWVENAVKHNRKSTRNNDVADAELDVDASGEIKPRGIGVIKANQAIDCLSRIPKNDALRKRGFQIVTDWIKANR